MFLSRFANKLNVPSAEESLPGRDTEMVVRRRTSSTARR